MAIYDEHRELIQIGAYRSGSNPQMDRAIALKPIFDAFLTQATDQIVPWKESWEALSQLIRN